jgi:hypothetical protein
LKKIAILGAVVVLLGCSAATVADDHKSLSTIEYKPVYKVNLMSNIVEASKTQTLLEQQAAEALRIKTAKAENDKLMIQNKRALEERLLELEKYVGKTWYVFSGSSPSG